VPITISDCDALNRIQELLDGSEWDSETMDNVAHAVRATGREIRDPADLPENVPESV
jgi:hypothetical protein